MTNKKVILLSAATYFALNTIIWLLGWLVWPIGFLAVWLLLGHVARKMSPSYMMEEKMWSYIMCNLAAPIVIIVLFVERYNEFSSKFSSPKFRNPFVWPEKEGK